MSDSDIKILLSSDGSYDELTVEIFYKDQFVALINRDGGIENLKIEFPSKCVDENLISRTIDLNIFEKAIELAKEKIKT
ncbi:hypothetical protein [Kiloniella sp.]|uniref:hypothetical protein n=1 Tax=Kiloniella sp. TaxID=1938587 RepID=UPI003B0177E4